MPAWLETTIHILTFLTMLFGLFGLIIPVFPGNVVMWLAALVYGLVFEPDPNLVWMVNPLPFPGLQREAASDNGAFCGPDRIKYRFFKFLRIDVRSEQVPVNVNVHLFLLPEIHKDYSFFQ